MKWMLNIGENKSKGLPKPKGERVTSWHFLFKRKVFLGEIISNHNEYTINRLFGQFTLPVKWSEFFYIRENRSKGLPESNGGSVTFWMFLLKRKSIFFFFFFLVRVLMDLCRPAFGQAWGFCYSRFSCSDFSLFFFEPWITCPAQIYK